MGLRGIRRTPVVIGLLGVLLALGLAGCGAGSAQAGDCVERDGEDYAVADCAGAQLQVLERLDSSGDCTVVAGVTESYTLERSYTLCIGPVGVDPATGVNAAQVGDCLSGMDAASGTAAEDVRRVDCADPAAGAQVLSRAENVSTVTFDDCGDTPGTAASYEWDLAETGEGVIADFDRDLLFCLGLPGVDPATSPDSAQAGACLAETGDAVGYAQVDCGSPEAAYEVVERIDNGFAGSFACDDATGATSSISRSGLDGYTLCLAGV